MAKEKAGKSTDKAKDDRKQEETEVYIAAIGASAGGLDPLKKVFSNIQPDSGIAYVVITHLDPHHSSMLPELLQKTTKLPVREIADGMEIEPDKVYVIKPDYEVVLNGRRFELEKRMRDKVTFPINTFLMSLAEQHRDLTIAIILSGTGTDGAAGIKAVKEKYGLVIAQDPANAQYNGMPEAALATGAVDQVMEPEKMGVFMAGYVTNRNKRLMRSERDQEVSSAKIHTICGLLQRRTGHDFSDYKQNTLIRRIGRRMDLHRLEGLDQYIHFVQENPDELDALFAELLIGVTNFFRDPPAWEVVKQTVFPIICEGKEQGADVRIWVAGVSTGEEAYTMAILFQEYMNEQNLALKPTIFATDIDEIAVEKARKGVYPPAISVDVSKERLEKYFTRQENAFIVRRDLRESVIFAPQNLLKDPPFSKLDLICCRNVLIYLNSSLQKKLIPMFHYSLNTNGVLFLGSSEGVGEYGDLFTTIDGKWKIFKRSDDAKRYPADFPMTRKAPEPPPPAVTTDLSKIIGQELLDEFVPACVVIDQDGRIQYIHGRTGKYLEPAQGEAQWDIYRMAREGLKNTLRAAIHQAITQNTAVSQSPVKVRTNGDSVRVSLHVKPFVTAKGGGKLLTVAFKEITETKELKAGQKAARDRSIEELELELKNTRENLQSTIEELETSNEEMRSMNEEYQSTNEELKSANEELETSREELQSLNEELTTVNSELQEKIGGLNALQKEMQIFLDSLDIPTIFLDSELRIVRFTAQAAAIFHILDSDIGRPIEHFASNLNDKAFFDDAHEVLKTLRQKEKEVQTTDGRWYLRRTLPYRATQSELRGIAINFVDIHSFKTASTELRKIEIIVGSITDVVTQPLVILDSQFNVMRASESFYGQFKLNAEQSVGQSFFELAGRMMNTSMIKDYFDVLQEGKHIAAITAGMPIGTQTAQVTIRARKVPYGLNHIWCVVFGFVSEKG